MPCHNLYGYLWVEARGRFGFCLQVFVPVRKGSRLLEIVVAFRRGDVATIVVEGGTRG